MSYDSGEGLTEKIFPFDTFIQINEEIPGIIIDRISHLLRRSLESLFWQMCPIS